MDERQGLAQRFDDNRPHLQAVAYRLLGSLSDADDAVQEAWLRLDRADVGDVLNLEGWLTTVVARVCLDMLRARRARREEPITALPPTPSTEEPRGADPEQEALLADSVGLAMMVVLQTLTPDERLAFVLHDIFDLPFATIAPIVGRRPNTAAQLAARARRRVRGKTPDTDIDVAGQRKVVEGFLAAARRGDINALIAVLDADVVLRADRAAGRTGKPLTVRGAWAVAGGATMFSEQTHAAQPVLVNGAVGLIVAPRGRLTTALRFNITANKITEIDIYADPQRLGHLDLCLLDAGDAIQ